MSGTRRSAACLLQVGERILEAGVVLTVTRRRNYMTTNLGHTGTTAITTLWLDGPGGAVKWRVDRLEMFEVVTPDSRPNTPKLTTHPTEETAR